MRISRVRATLVSRVASMTMFPRAIFLLLAMVLIGTVGTPTSTWAHPGTSSAIITSPLSPSAAASTVPVEAVVRTGYPPQGTRMTVLLLSGMTVALWLAGRCARRLRLAALSILLILTGFEAAIHSVHHLGDPHAAEHCLVASSGDHVTGLNVGVLDVSGLMMQASGAPLLSQPSFVRLVSLGPDAGRAPPA